MFKQDMLLQRRRGRGPLGRYVPESRAELHAEKTLFRRQAMLLRDMFDSRNMRRGQNTFGFDTGGHFLQTSPVRQLNSRTTYEHSNSKINRSSENPKSGNEISPDVRWLMTRSAKLQRVNDAGYYVYRNRVEQRVVSAAASKPRNNLVQQRPRSMCSRNDTDKTTSMAWQQSLHCDVLGPNFCTDCRELNQKVVTPRVQRMRFPRVEVHTRSLVAPEKVEKIYLKHQDKMFHQDKKYACGCQFDARLEITTPIVYTPHEVFERIRRKKKLEQRDIKGSVEDIKKPLHESAQLSLNDKPSVSTEIPTVTSSSVIDKRPSFIEEKTEPPMDMTVSVKFINNNY